MSVETGNEGLSVECQHVVPTGSPRWEEAGYGKDGKLKNAFLFPTTPAAATEMYPTETGSVPAQASHPAGAKAQFSWEPHSARLKSCPDTKLEKRNNVLKLHT